MCVEVWDTFPNLEKDDAFLARKCQRIFVFSQIDEEELCQAHTWPHVQADVTSNFAREVSRLCALSPWRERPREGGGGERQERKLENPVHPFVRRLAVVRAMSSSPEAKVQRQWDMFFKRVQASTRIAGFGLKALGLKG